MLRGVDQWVVAFLEIENLPMKVLESPLIKEILG
jgi:hypothetical protein